MSIHRVLFFCFSSAALFDGNAGLVEDQFTKLEGEDFNMQFNLPEARRSKIYLCRNNCTKEDILVETVGNRIRNDKYIIRYDSNTEKMQVGIMGLKQSDTGRYKVGMRNVSPDSYKEFKIKVRALCEEVSGEPRIYSATEGENITITCFLFLNSRNRKFLCREKCNKLLFDTNDVTASSERFTIQYRNRTQFDVTFTRLTKSDSGRYRCGVGKQEATNTCQDFEITVAGAGGVLVLAVCLTVVIVLLAICAGLLLLYKWKRRNAEYVNSGGNGRNMEISNYENTAGVSTHEEPVYQDLEPQSSDNNVYYSIRT